MTDRPASNGHAAEAGPRTVKHLNQSNVASKKRTGEEAKPVTIAAVLDILQVARHEAAVLEHLADYVEQAFLASDTGVPRLVVATGTGCTEIARAQAVLAIQDMLLDRAVRARTRAEQMLQLMLRDVPKGQTHLLEAPHDETARELHGEEHRWASANDKPVANANRLRREPSR